MQNEEMLLQGTLDKNKHYEAVFYNQFDRLVWDLAGKWIPTIEPLSKNSVDLEELHSVLWIHIFSNLNKCDLERAKLSSWIHVICKSKLGMIVRHLKTKKVAITNESSFSLNANLGNEYSSNNKKTELMELVGVKTDIADDIANKDFMLDFVYSLLELVDACTDKERKVYLLKIKGESQSKIAELANVSKSYVPKVYRRLTDKLKQLYFSLNEQTYVDKEERNALAKDLILNKRTTYICEKYELEIETVEICKEMLSLIEF